MKSIWELDFKQMVSPGIASMQSTVNKAFASLAIHENQLANAANKATSAAEHTEGAWHRVKEVAEGMLAATGLEMGVEKVVEFGKEILTSGMKMSAMKTQFSVLTGSIESGSEAFEKLNDLYRKFPIMGKENIMQAGKTLEEVGVPIDKIRTKLEQFGNVSGGDASKFGELAGAYQKAVAFGSVPSRMLMSQPILMQAIGKELHMNAIQLKKFAAEGDVSLKVLDKAFNNLTGTGGRFSGMLAMLNNDFVGKLARMKEGAEEMSEKIFLKISPFINRFLDFGEGVLPKVENALRMVWNAGKDLNEWIDKHTGLLYVVAGAVSALTIAYGIYQAMLLGIAAKTAIASFATSAYLVYLEMQTGATLVAALAMLGLNAAFLASPITWVVMGIGALVGGIIYAWKHFEGFRMVVLGLWETFKQVFTNIGGFFAKIFSPIGEAIAAFKKGDIGGMGIAVGKLAFNLATLPMQAAVFAADGGLTKNTKEAYATGAAKGANSHTTAAKTAAPGEGDAITSNSKAGSKTEAADTTVGGSSSGGGFKEGKSVIINIYGGLVHTMHVVSGGKGVNNMKQEIEEVLLSVVNNTELAA